MVSFQRNWLKQLNYVPRRYSRNTFFSILICFRGFLLEIRSSAPQLHFNSTCGLEHLSQTTLGHNRFEENDCVQLPDYITLSWQLDNSERYDLSWPEPPIFDLEARSWSVKGSFLPVEHSVTLRKSSDPCMNRSLSSLIFTHFQK